MPGLTGAPSTVCHLRRVLVLALPVALAPWAAAEAQAAGVMPVTARVLPLPTVPASEVAALVRGVSPGPTSTRFVVERSLRLDIERVDPHASALSEGRAARRARVTITYLAN